MRVRQRVSSKATMLPTTIIFLFKHETECHVWTRIDNNRQRTGNTGYPAELFPMEVQVALDHVPTTRKSTAPAAIGSLLLVGLVGSLGGLPGNLFGGGGLDHTDCDGLPHVPDGEPSKGRELGEGLDAHGLAWEQLDDGGVTRLDELRGRPRWSCRYACPPSPGSRRTCRQCGRCGNQARGSSRWTPVRGGSARSPGP